VVVYAFFAVGAGYVLLREKPLQAGRAAAAR